MRRMGLFSVAVGLCAGVVIVAGAAQAPLKLTQQDIIDIQQINARYVYAVDTCTNAGLDYADLYTEDGTFGVATDWGVAGVVWARGREGLARAGGGGEQGCVQKKPTSPTYGIHHVTTGLVITPTAQGAAGKSTLLAIGVGGSPTNIEWQGGYEDRYVKTVKGWRIQSRWHVWLDMDKSLQFRAMTAAGFKLPTESVPDPTARSK